MEIKTIPGLDKLYTPESTMYKEWSLIGDFTN